MINKDINYLDSDKNHIYKENTLKKDQYTTYNLEEVLNNKIQNEKNKKIKQGLEIILTLISQKNKYIKAYALGKIYFLMEDEYTKEIIVNELKILSNYNNKKISQSALNSLDLIALNIYKLKIIEMFYHNLKKLYKYINFKTSKFNLINILSKKMGLDENSKTKIENNYYIYDYNNIIGKLLSFNQLNGLNLYLDKIEILNNECIGYELLNQNYNQILELNKNDALHKLAAFYTHTFNEKGHLRRLVALLYDDEYKVQKIGTDALIEISKTLLSHSGKKEISSPLISFNKFSILKKIHSR